MDPLEFAIRRYLELTATPAGSERHLSTNLSNLAHWLENDVCLAIRNYLPRAKFQQEASWAVRNLTAGSASNERQAIEEVDDALVDAGRRLLAIVNHSLIQPALRVDNPPLPQAVSTVITGGGTRRQSPSWVADSWNLTTDDLNLVRQISTRFWDDLASTADYFAPCSNWGSFQKRQFAEFNPSLSRVVPTLGDVISACLLHQVNLFHSDLKKCRNKCFHILRRLELSVPELQRDCETVLEVLDQKIGTLRSLIQVNPYSPRSACIALTQLFLIFNPRTDVSWLGLEEQTLLDGPSSLRAHLTDQRNTEFYDSVAVSLAQLKLLYQNEPANQSALEEAIATGSLVIDQVAKTVYWESRLIDYDWHRNAKPWTLLIVLARATRRQQSVTDQDVYGDSDEPKTPGALTQLVSRLKRELPVSLRELISAGHSTQSYRLTLSRNRVHLV